MNHKYPFTSLHLQIDPTLVDVNVHPTKLEVRFKNASDIYDLIYDSVRTALKSKELITQVKLVEEKEESKTIKNAPEPFEENRRQEELKKASYDSSHKVQTSQGDNKFEIAGYNIEDISGNKSYANNTFKRILLVIPIKVLLLILQMIRQNIYPTRKKRERRTNK